MLGVYIHIPYCEGKCYYCDFYSAGASKSVPDAYIDALLRDIQATSGCVPLRPDTVYFGGGTPSLLEPQQVRRILAALCPAPEAEITLEANPCTVTQKKLHDFRENGINRLSVGVQTAFDESLSRLGRRHTAKDSRDVLQWAIAEGFSNISGDIMLALPQYSTQEMIATIDLLQEGGCSHISSYLLKIESGTVFGMHPPAFLPDEDSCADFYLDCVSTLAKRGYAQYEISNFAKEKKESHHNLIYWQCNDYLGFGPTAHSCVRGRRYSVPRGTSHFIQAPQIAQEEGIVSAEDFIMLQLRLSTGLSISVLQEQWHVSFTSAQMNWIDLLQKQALAVFDGDVLTLTPQGMLVQNSIVCELI